MTDQLTITRNVYRLLVEAKRERNRLLEAMCEFDDAITQSWNAYQGPPEGYDPLWQTWRRIREATLRPALAAAGRNDRP